MRDNNRINESMSSIINRRSIYYTTILSHFITKDGKQMVCGLKSGKLALFDIHHILKQNIDFDNKSLDEPNVDAFKPMRRPQQIVTTDCPIYSLVTITDKLFVSGSKGFYYCFECLTANGRQCVPNTTLSRSLFCCLPSKQ